MNRHSTHQPTHDEAPEASTASRGVPLLTVEGDAAECGRQLGAAWAAALREQCKADEGVPWWRDKRWAPLVETYAPHLPTLFTAMAKGAGLSSSRIAPLGPWEAGGCTSFALHPSVTLTGRPMSGQTKDTPISRRARFQVLRLKMSNAPSMLTLTYPGWLFGHGFVVGGCALWRNSLHTGAPQGLPLPIWGMLAQHCETVEDAIALTETHGIDAATHTTIVDTRGGVAGVEATDAGVAVLRDDAGIYVHANAVRGRGAMTPSEHDTDTFYRAESERREARLTAHFQAERGRLAAPQVMRMLADHENYPVSICRHQGDQATTTAAVIAEPTSGRLHVVRGHPCCNAPVTYTLD